MTTSNSQPLGDASPDRTLNEVLGLKEVGEYRFVCDAHEANNGERAFGGSLMAASLNAAARTVTAPRVPTALQVLFAQGARLDLPVEYSVTIVQEGKRFSARHVRVSQEGRCCMEVNASFQVPTSGPEQQIDARAQAEPPEALVATHALGPEYQTCLERIGFVPGAPYALESRPVDPRHSILEGPKPGEPFEYWIRARMRLGDETADHAAAFAYISDYWAAYTAISPHVQRASGPMMRPTSLNQTIWFHCPFRADDWLLATETGFRAGGSRGLGIARFHSRSGVLVATVARELLMVERS